MDQVGSNTENTAGEGVAEVDLPFGRANRDLRTAVDIVVDEEGRGRCEIFRTVCKDCCFVPYAAKISWKIW